jgi:hypothetical protein
MSGFVASVLSFTRRTRNGAKVGDVKSNPGGSANITAEHMGPSGDDSPPFPSDSLGAFAVEGTGRFVAGGYADPVNEGVANPGEVRRYARDGVGSIVATIYMKADGTITISNDNGSFAMAPSGVVTINGVTIDTSGNIVSPGEVTASGVTLTGHTHAPGSLATPTESVTSGTTAAGAG